jgi:hypothetical protein
MVGHRRAQMPGDAFPFIKGHQGETKMTELSTMLPDHGVIVFGREELLKAADALGGFADGLGETPAMRFAFLSTKRSMLCAAAWRID